MDKDPLHRRSLRERYANFLHNGGEPWEYLVGRGLQPETIRRFSLGYVERPLQEGHERYRGRIVLPYLSALGTEQTLRFHSFDQSHGKHKYLQPFGVPLGVFNVRATDGSHVYVCEGEFDTIVLSQCGYNAVGLPGSTSWHRAWRFLFRDCDTVSVVTDPDEPGRNLAFQVCRDIGQMGIPVRDIELPQRLDVNDWMLKDEDRLRELLNP